MHSCVITCHDVSAGLNFARYHEPMIITMATSVRFIVSLHNGSGAQLPAPRPPTRQRPRSLAPPQPADVSCSGLLDGGLPELIEDANREHGEPKNHTDCPDD